MSPHPVNILMMDDGGGFIRWVVRSIALPSPLLLTAMKRVMVVLAQSKPKPAFRTETEKTDLDICIFHSAYVNKQNVKK